MQPDDLALFRLPGRPAPAADGSVVVAVNSQWRASPLAFADRVDVRLLIIHSEQDWRCPVEQAQRLFVALKLGGAQVEMLLFPGEGHELSRSGRPRHRHRRFDAILDWWGPLPADLRMIRLRRSGGSSRAGRHDRKVPGRPGNGAMQLVAMTTIGRIPMTVSNTAPHGEPAAGVRWGNRSRRAVASGTAWLPRAVHERVIDRLTVAGGRHGQARRCAVGKTGLTRCRWGGQYSQTGEAPAAPPHRLV